MFRVPPPALISFSGGRTSAYMLRRILDAYDGHLPPDVHVQFSNTGKERPETLDFVRAIGERWRVPIRWIEWRPRPSDGLGNDRYQAWLHDQGHPERLELVTEAGYQEVGHNSASRAGEPFRALIALKSYAPNAVTRFCSLTLKVETAKRFAQQALNFTHWDNIVGLRHDEGHRILKALARNDEGKEPFKARMPLGAAHITKRDVLDFWWGPGRTYETRTYPQGFDLELRSYEGNCDLCFLKSREKKVTIIRENPHVEAWWIESEAFVQALTGSKGASGLGGQFVTEYSVAELAQLAHGQGFFDFGQPGADNSKIELGDAAADRGDDDEEADVECGLVCA